MSETRTFTCDNCGKQRVNDTNHWFTLRIVQLTSTEKEVIVRTFRFALPAGTGFDACGQQCVLAMVARFLSTGELVEAKQIRVQE